MCKSEYLAEFEESEEKNGELCSQGPLFASRKRKDPGY